MVNGMANSFNVTHDDVNYVALPLYHSNGGVGGIGMMIYRGATVIVAKRFSASRFFQECQRHGATVCVSYAYYHTYSNLEIPRCTSIDRRNLKVLAVEMYKISHGKFSKFINDLIEQLDMKYHTRSFYGV